MKFKIVSPLTVANSLTEYWSPKIISEVEDSFVKVAKVKGALVWHSHDDEDELFFILHGSLSIHYEDHSINLNSGDLHVVPKGIRHLPEAKEECLILLIEKKTTMHTGNVDDPKTKTISQQLKEYLPT